MNSNKQYVLTFTGVMNIIVTLVMIIVADIGTTYGAGWVLTLKTILFITLYLFLALTSGNTRGIIDALSYIVLIHGDNELGAAERLNQIRSKIDELVNAYNDIFSEIRNFAKPYQKIFAAVWYEMKKASHGEIKPIQGLWVFGYISYLIIVQTNYFNIPLPFDIITSIGFNMLLQFTSVNLRGIGNVISDISGYAKNESIKENEILNKIARGIKDLCIDYSIIAKGIQTKFGKPIYELLSGTKNE